MPSLLIRLLDNSNLLLSNKELSRKACADVTDYITRRISILILQIELVTVHSPRALSRHSGRQLVFYYRNNTPLKTTDWR